MSEMHGKNQAAFESMKLKLLERFPIGHFVAIDNGNLVADAGLPFLRTIQYGGNEGYFWIRESGASADAC